IRVRLGQSDQPIARLFFRTYCGSGLVIQWRARFQLTPIRRRASRMVSSLTRAFVRPCAKQTSATRFNVHSERGLSKLRGEVCSRARKPSHLAASSSGSLDFGAEDFRCKHATPSRSKSRITLRTVWSVQPSSLAICRGVLVSALARRIWQRRSRKASPERMPARNVARALSVKERTKSGSFIYPIFSQLPAIQKGRLVLH